MRLDLHLHSTASDGVYSPSEVVNIALTNHVNVIALTDHDNVSGLEEARKAAGSSGLMVLPGVELSSEEKKKDRHILGYMFNPLDQPFLSVLAELRGARVGRAERIVQKLGDLGVQIPLKRVYDLAGTGSVGRPHVAQAMLEGGYVHSLQEAFDKYLSDSGPAFVPHYQLDPAGAIDLLHRAGGVAILAHPGRLDEDYHPVVEALVPLGLDGLEAFYPDHTPAIVEDLTALAKRH
ncbi:MAG TPA: PHP domain-containing protein, partial [Aggregatilineales bacterium]|nr:PHP domain-containing protein [Aggregatilineales bacterium]